MGKGTKVTKCLVVLLLVPILTMSSGCVSLHFERWGPTPDDGSAPPALSTPGPINPDWQLPPHEDSISTLPDFAAVVDKVKPSVVAIRTGTGAGSGWIIHNDGIIVTNNHVIAGAQNIRVALFDGRTYTAAEVRGDPFTDLAIIKINAQDLPVATVGDSSKLRLGNPVCVIGNALGEGISMTGGWVSQLGASITLAPGQTLEDLIRTDAAINPGNSGGPLVNMAGEVVGITSVKIAQVGVEGFGYAISLNSARGIIEELITKGYVIRPYLGVGVQTVNPIVAFFNNLSVNQGALVTNLASGSPADLAGIRRGDVITEIDGKTITNAHDLIQITHSGQIGQQVEIVYWRGKDKFTTKAILIESPPPY